MSEVTVIPSNSDNSLGVLAFVLVALIGLVLLGIFAYNNGWLSMRSSNPDNSIDISVPAQDPTAAETTSEAGVFAY